MSDVEKIEPIFRNLTADDPEVTEIESLCMNCQENGMTRLLLTKIPFFKEVVIMSFACESCGFENNEIQSGGEIAEKGVRIVLNVRDKRDLNRQVVKSDYASVKIVELDFEIPAKSQKGEVTTVEGIISRSITGLEQQQVLRRIQHPEIAAQIDEFIKKLEALKNNERPFTLQLEDISGNSFVENPNAPATDENCSSISFKRTTQQDQELGIYKEEHQAESLASARNETGLLHRIKENEFPLEEFEGEVLQFRDNCPNCHAPCEINMKMTNIPHFKEVIIMATICEACGMKTNEVKSGAGIEPKGIKIEVTVSDKEDLTRDVLKSECCALLIPELKLDVGSRALGGRFTTVEGLLVAMKNQLLNESLMFGDSQDAETKERFVKFLADMDDAVALKTPFTLVLDDPTGNSYVQSMNDDDTTDEKLKIEHYERTFEQNEELGLNDIKTENYENDT